MNDVEWSLIEVFLRVATEGSFTRAATRLGTSQPTVSRQVRALEERLGVSLFARHARGFELTNRGAALLETARQVEADVQTLLRRASGMTSEVGGAVRVSASEPVAAHLLTRFAAELRESWPGITLDVVAENRAADLLRREADLAVRMFRPTQLDLVVRQVAEIPVGLYAHESYIARHGLPERLEDLKDHALVGWDADSTGFEVLTEVGIRREDYAFRTDSLVAQIEAIRAGVGIGGAQAPIMEAAPGVRRVLPEMYGMPVWLAVHGDLRHSPTVRTAFDALAAFFGRLVG